MRCLAKTTVILTCLFLLISEVGNSQNLETISKEKPVQLNGSIAIHAINYQAKGIANRRQPFSYFLNSNLGLQLYGLYLPFSFTYSEQERNFSQPFNQFGISPQYKWLTLHGGYRNIQFSPYTLAGVTTLGYGIEMNPGKWKIGFMYGRLNRATEIDSSTGFVRPYSFARKGMAGKVGFGGKRSYIEFSTLKAWDDSNSVKNKLNAIDSLAVMPAANLVSSAKMSLGITKKVRIFGDVAYSLYTNNINSAVKMPTALQDIANLLKPVLTVNATTERFLAFSGGIEFESSLFGLKLGYQQVDPDFKSMGAYFFNTDIKNITIAPSFHTKTNRFRLNGSLGIQQDNVLKTRETTTKRLIGNGNLSWMPNHRFGLDINFSNYSSNATPQVVNLNNKFILSVSNSNLSVTPRYTIIKPRWNHVFILNYNQSVINDFNQTLAIKNSIKSTIALFNYTVQHIPSNWQVGSSFSQSQTQVLLANLVYRSVALNISKAAFKNKLSIQCNGVYSFANVSSTPNLLNGNLIIHIRPSKHHHFFIRNNYLSSKPQAGQTNTNSFSEFTNELAYTYHF